MILRLRGLAPGVAFGLLLIDFAGMLVLLAVRPQFLSTYNLFVTGRDLSILLLVALAQMIVLSLGQVNLSIGSIGGLVAIIESGLIVRYGVPVPVALVAVIVHGLVDVPYWKNDLSLELWALLSLTLAAGAVSSAAPKSSP